MGVERLFFSRNVQTALGVGQARGVVLLAAAQHGTPGPRGDPERGQERDRGLRRGRQGTGPADGPARPRDERAATTRRRGRRAGDRDVGRQHGSRRGPGHGRRSGIAPPSHRSPAGETGYERAVREALAERARRRQAQRLLARDAVIASVEGVVGAVAADSLVIEVGGLGYRVFAAPAVLAAAQPGKMLKLHTYHLVREDQQALYGFRSAEELGFFNLLLTVNGVGPKVALAIVGSRGRRRTSSSRSWPRTRPSSSRSRGSARSWPSGSSSSSRRR